MAIATAGVASAMLPENGAYSSRGKRNTFPPSLSVPINNRTPERDSSEAYHEVSILICSLFFKLLEKKNDCTDVVDAQQVCDKNEIDRQVDFVQKK
ncbi:MAG: hypothetical protein ACR5LF_07990 [Symbiopectobacterium sp.]